MAVCKSCGKQIEWIATPTGRMMPVDPGQVFFIQDRNGDKNIITKDGLSRRCRYTENGRGASGVGYVPHWSTCDAPEKFRKRRKR